MPKDIHVYLPVCTHIIHVSIAIPSVWKMLHTYTQIREIINR